MNEKKNIFLKNMKQLRIGSFITVLCFAVYLVSMVLKLGTLSGIIALAGAGVAIYVMFSAIMYEGEGMTRSFTWGQGAMALLMMLFAYGTIKQWLGL